LEDISKRLDRLVVLVKANAVSSKKAAVAAAEDVKAQLHEDLEVDRKTVHGIEERLKRVEAQLTGVADSLGKLASAKLLQQAFTGLILGALFTTLVKVLGG
jgi:archaellum component FlaC